MNSLSFSDFYLNEGGNIKINGVSSEKISIENMSEEDFEAFKGYIFNFLKKLNENFNKQHQDYIWRHLEKNFKQGSIFAGSSKFFITKSYDEFSRHKKEMGDVDIQFPKEKYKDLVDYLASKENTKIADFQLIGLKPAGTQINLILKAPASLKKSVTYFQMDLEVVDFENNEPTKFSAFGRGSDWEDLKQNVKGVFKNYLFASLMKRVEVENDAYVLNKKGVPEPIGNLSNLVFSVDKGLRFRYSPVLDEKGKMVLTKGKPTYRETTTEDKNYDKNLERIFAFAFGDLPNPAELQKMNSFFGLLDLMKKYYDDDDLRKTFDNFVSLLWDPKSKILDKEDSKDIELKMAPYNKFVERFPSLKKSPGDLEKLIAAYYKGK